MRATFFSSAKVKHPLVWRLTLLALAILLTGSILSLSVLEHYRRLAERVPLEQVKGLPELNAIYDVHGNIYSWMHGENRVNISLKEVPRIFIDALLAREDTRFYQHHGVDLRGICRAMCHNLTHVGHSQGGSTITQQLARNAFSLKEHTFQRKLLEAMVARRIEKRFSKDEILELYLNRIYFGAGAYGLESACRTYFSKSCKDLTLSEAATLVGVIRSPHRSSPFIDQAKALFERNLVLRRMLELNLITQAQAAVAKSTELVLAQHENRGFRVVEDYAVDSVQRELATVVPRETLNRGGLRIYTTLDPELQKTAAEALKVQLAIIEKQKGYDHPTKSAYKSNGSNENPTAYLQAALVAIDNRNGAIRAIVGGRDYTESTFNRAVQAQRQVGSAFKPFVYAAAFEHGLKPGTLIDDSELQSGEVRGVSSHWSPANSDTQSRGFQRADAGLIQSRNTMSVRIGETIGSAAAANLCMKLKLASHVEAYPALYLGAFEATPRALTSAYTVFPNGGIQKQSYLIEQIINAQDEVVYHSSPSSTVVLSPEAAWVTSTILQEVLRTGTAARSRAMGFTKPGAGKTGTTDEFHDAWFVGYTTSLTCGVWVGFDQPKTISAHGYGSALALPIWARFMESASTKDYKADEFKTNVKLSKVRLCSVSGNYATADCDADQTSYEATLPVKFLPKEACHQGHPTLYADQRLDMAQQEVDGVQEAVERYHVSTPDNEGSVSDSSTSRVKVRLCQTTHALASSGCEWAGTAYDDELPITEVPRGICKAHEEVPFAPTASAHN